MSRPTAAQVIECGDYLEPDFDPTELTIPHLLSILTLHGVRYPTPHNKSKLVQAFKDEIKPRAARFKRERLKNESSVASSKGITDALTGESLSDEEPPQEQLPQRRFSRRLSRPPSLPPAPAMPEPSKRRRSSAGPTLSRAPSKVTLSHEPILLEESEPEDEPVKKVGRPRKSAAAAGPQGRRVSQAEDVEGWSDNNVFQSGAESSSPARPSPNGRAPAPVRRTTRKGRTSMSAPPQIPSSSPFAAPPSSPTFDPQISADFPGRRSAQRELAQTSRHIIPKLEQRSSPSLEGNEAESAVVISDEDLSNNIKLNKEVSKAIANGGSAQVLARRTHPAVQPTSIWKRVVLGAVALTLTGITVMYKIDSVSIGYCHPGTKTNRILGERQIARMEARECTERLAKQAEEGQSTHNISCTPLPLIPLPEPMSCTPCPAHANCTPHNVTCDQSFVLHQHPLAVVQFLPEILNGLPGMGPVAFPPSCVEDEERKRNIGRLGVGLENYLAITRGQRLCMGVSLPPNDGGEAAQWGVEIDGVHNHLKRLTVIQKKVVKADEFESVFQQAIDDLHRYGYVTISEDPSGIKYIAAVRTQLDLPCKFRIAARNAWNEWKSYFFASFLVTLFAYWMRGQIAARRIESRRVGELVQVALDTLRNQEIQHHTDPVTAPRPYLSSLHLRDLILQKEHSIPARRRLWDKVEKVVEGNTNVRASIEELAGGDEGRVWRWVGNTPKNIKTPSP